MKTTEQLLKESQLNVCKLIDILEKKDIEIARLKDYIKVNEFHSNARLNSLIELQKKYEELQKKYNRDVGNLVNNLHSRFCEDTMREIEIRLNSSIDNGFVPNGAYEDFVKSYYETN